MHLPSSFSLSLSTHRKHSRLVEHGQRRLRTHSLSLSFSLSLSLSQAAQKTSQDTNAKETKQRQRVHNIPHTYLHFHHYSTRTLASPLVLWTTVRKLPTYIHILTRSRRLLNERPGQAVIYVQTWSCARSSPFPLRTVYQKGVLALASPFFFSSEQKFRGQKKSKSWGLNGKRNSSKFIPGRARVGHSTEASLGVQAPLARNVNATRQSELTKVLWRLECGVKSQVNSQGTLSWRANSKRNRFSRERRGF